MDRGIKGIRLAARAVGIAVLWAASTALAHAQPAGSATAEGDWFSAGAAGQEKVVSVGAQFTDAKPRQPSRIFITATIKPGWHIYSITQPPKGGMPTTIKFRPSDAFRAPTGFFAYPAPEKKDEGFPVVSELHEETVTWFAPLEITPGTDLSALRIEGTVKLQACDPNSCIPQEVPFTARLGPGVAVPEVPEKAPPVEKEPAAKQPAETQVPAKAEPVAGDKEAKDKGKLPWRPYTTFESFRLLLDPSFDPEILKGNIRKGFAESNLLWEVLLGFLGGVVLNLMPCVLPVIGLKVLSFVEQSGHERRRALLLNIWYSAGLMSIFLLLATLAVFLNLGWGHLFKYPGFNIVLAAVVFAMGLSFLGVWEIPIPGFIGRGGAASLAEKEGLPGAFAKGVIATILATPCTGPFMAGALAWAVNQPPLNTYVVFSSVGLGMASPYLLIGAFPGIIRFLPRPGAWMETFQQIMGFVLLGTVVYIFTFLRGPFAVPTFGLLFAVWAACWWLGRTPLTAEFPVKARAWLEAAALVGVAWLLLFPGISGMVSGRFAFRGLYEVMKGRSDEAAEREAALRLEKLRHDGYELVYTGRKEEHPTGPNTVLVDFTADWCLTCKTFEAQVLNTPEVRQLVEENRVVALKADWTDEAPEVTKLMDLLGARGVPIIAIFPANDPNNPAAIFRGAYTQQQLLDALRAAGPSKPPS